MSEKNKKHENSIPRSMSERLFKVCIHFILIIISAVCLYSFLIVLGSSFQTQEDIFANGYRIIPKEFTFGAYEMIASDLTALINSYVVTIVTTVVGTLLGLWICSSYAYVISRKDYKYRGILTFLVFFTMLFNGGMVANYILISKWLSLQNNIWALILPLMVSAWNIFIMKSFFMSIPASVIESAKIDGANEFAIFTRMVIPMSKPAFATVGLFITLGYWNDWWLSLLYISDDNKLKLQYLLMRVLRNMEFLNSEVALQLGIMPTGTEVPTLSARMAMCVIAAGPILVVFPFFQKFFVKGLTLGSVKE